MSNKTVVPNEKGNDKITVIEEALLKNITGGGSSDDGEIPDHLVNVVECTGK